MQNEKPWVGVDLDGTLAFHDSENWDPMKVGQPIPNMMAQVKRLIAKGIRVKIFTARAAHPELIPPIQEWLEKNGLGKLEVTNVKDFKMIQLYDDRAVQIIENTGLRADGVPW